MRLNFFNNSWPLRPDICSCDLDFLAYLKFHQIKNKMIFHFGSGAHHILGRENCHDQPNEILAITASPEEHIAYIDLIINDANIARNYKVLFADIYTLSRTFLPSFDLVTLFHLHEFYEEGRNGYAQLNDMKLLELFLSKLNTGGLVFFYKGSDGFAQTRDDINTLVDRGVMSRQDEFKSLLIYRRRYE